MTSRYMDFPSPRGVHVPETYYSNDPDDPYRRPPSRRNRYNRSGHQTPRFRDVTWISTPDQIPPSPWISPASQAPPSPAHRPPSTFPSPAPTVGERMALDELAFVQDDFVDLDPYQRPHRPGFVKSFLKGLKKLSGFRPAPSFPIPRPSSYGSQMIGMPAPQLSALSEYVDPTPPESGTGTGTEEQRGPIPYTSPYVRPAKITATPSVIRGSLRASPAPVYSPVPVHSLSTAPPITIISPSIPPSPRPNSVRSIRSARPATPGPVTRTFSVNASESSGSTEEASQTLHEHVFPTPARPPGGAISVVRSDEDEDKSPIAPVGSGGGGILLQSPVVDRSFSNGSLASTMARVRRFVADLDSLPWHSDEQIADEYVPEKNWRSQMRKKARQGAEPSWYNPRPEVVERPAYWAEWDMWAKQSTAALWGGTVGVGEGGGEVGRGWAGVGAHGGLGPPGPAPWGAVYPHGYATAQPAFVYPPGYPPLGAANQQGQLSVL